MTFLDIISIFVVLANLSLGLFVFIKGPKKKANIFFFLLTIAIAGWVANSYVSNTNEEYIIALWCGRAAFIFAALIVPLFIYFVIFFSKPINFLRKWLIFLGIPPFIFTILSFTDLVFEDTVQNAIGGLNGSDYGPFYTVYCIYILTYFIIGFFLFYKKYKSGGRIERMKLRYIILGFAIGSSAGVFTNLIWPLFINPLDVRTSLYGPLFTIFMTILMAYAILRYRLMDIRVVIRKGVVHILSFVILLFIYIYILIYLQKYLTQQYQWPEQTGIIILVLLIVITVEPLRRFLFRIIDQVFYARKKEAREKAKRLKLILSSSLEFDKLINKVKNELQDFLEVEDIQFVWHNKKTGRLENYHEKDRKVVINPTEPLFNYLQEKPEIIVTEEIPYLMEERSASEADVLKNIEKKLNDLGIALIWPVGEKGELIGAFLVGQKAKKEAFTSENLQYLSNIQFQTTMAVANALLYKQAVERIATFK